MLRKSLLWQSEDGGWVGGAFLYFFVVAFCVFVVFVFIQKGKLEKKKSKGDKSSIVDSFQYIFISL